MRFSRIIGILLCAILVVSIPCGASAKDYGYIDITNPFIRKIPLAVPIFKTYGDDERASDLARELSDILSDTLDFTGYFSILDRQAFLEGPQSLAIIAPNIRFDNWTAVGAEMMVTGGLKVSEGLLDLQLRLFDVFKQDLIVGKQYTARIEDRRQIVRRFCSDIIYALTGSRGFFDSFIAFVSTGSGNKEVYFCDFDGFRPRQVTHNEAITVSPAISADRQWIAYTAYNRGKPDLYIRNLEQKRGTVVDRPGINVSPAWRPGRFELAATLSFSGDPEIYLLTGTGKITKRLTHSRGIDVSPSWSPDGKQIAFVSKRSGTPQIYIKDLENGAVRRLTFEGRYNTQPAWSPRGDRIAFSGMDKAGINIFTIGTDGHGLRQMTHDAADNESPSWSPDGSMIVFSSTREGPSRIYVMTAFGTDQRRLVSLPGNQSEPVWSSGGGNQ